MRYSIHAVGAIATMLLIAACAATSPNAKPPMTAAAQDPSCLKQTGSRITNDNAGCKGVGSTYSKGDVDRTGATTAGEALRDLDPAITITH